MRKAISDNMMYSVHNMAHAYHKIRLDMSACIAARESFKSEGLRITYTDILIKAISKALKDFPFMNASLTEKGIVQKNYVNMGIAVAIDNGLIVPNIKNADLLSLAEIAEKSSELIKKAKEGSLKPNEISGGTFTITNLGMYEIDEFIAIINPPESGIIAVGKIVETPFVNNGQIIIKPLLTICLTYDHRIIDGAPAAMFLERVKKIVENPWLMM